MNLSQFRYSQCQFKVQLATFRIAGGDTLSFLQNQSTFDVKTLKEGEFHLASFLDPQGRTECFGWLVNNGLEYLYLVPVVQKDSANERLNRFLISEDVEIEGSVDKDWFFALGRGTSILFDEKAEVSESSFGLDTIPDDLVELWRGLTGWPRFDATADKDLITNHRLFDLAVTMNKGCYPGQETVSKIATRRGAAYAPVLLEVDNPIPNGEITNFGKKIGTVEGDFAWNGKHYLAASILRDFRVENMEISIEDKKAIVRYYPLLKGEMKAKELYWDATDDFRHDKFEEAESKFRLAIELDPTFADAYESLGVMLGRQERFQEALEVMQSLNRVDPKSVLAHTNMSLFLMRLGRIEEAEEQKSQATLKSFAHFGAEADLKEQAEKQKQAQLEEWKKRESMFLQVLEIDEEDTLANYGVGSIAVEKGEWERARMHLERVLTADPKYSVAYLALGKAFVGLKMKEKAKEIWSEGIKVAASKGDLMPANQMQSEISRI